MAAGHTWGRRSRECLATVEPVLAELCGRVRDVLPFDLTVTCGRRSRADQEEAVRTGRSHVHWPHGKHNVEKEDDLARAVDIHPYPIDFKDTARYLVMHGAFMAEAHRRGVKIRHGIDWDGDGVLLTDQRLDDYPHVELA